MAMDSRKRFDLAAKLQEVSNLDIGNRPQLEYIDIDFIDPDPKNRKVEGIKELAQNIALVGLQQPLAVRANPEQPGRVIVISGHRRREALKSLVDEGEEKYRMVPCLVTPPGMSEAMIRLMLLSGNMVTQALTPAQLAEATKELEDAIYALKEEGHEFPGKVRDYVAQACGIAGSRVTRLKAIREKLSPHWAPYFESGDLAESSAYELSRMEPHLQAQSYWVLTRGGTAPVKDIPAWRLKAVADHAEEIKAAEESICEVFDKRRCCRALVRRDTAIKDGAQARCVGCCKGCPLLYHCPQACDPGKAWVKERNAEQEAEKAALHEREAQEAARVMERKAAALRFALSGWRRLGAALERAGKSSRWLADTLDWDPDEMDEWGGLLEGAEATEANKYWAEDHPLQDMYTPDLINLADALGCSLDYLFGRTDEPVGSAGGAVTIPPNGEIIPRWFPGDQQPQVEGVYWCKVCLGVDTMIMKLVWEGQGGGWLLPAGLDPVSYPVTGWWPLPPDCDNDEEDKAG